MPYTKRRYLDEYRERLACHPPDACLEWHGDKNVMGYGRVQYQGKRWYAHRLMHYLTTGELPPHVRHTCDNPSCANPAHLIGGTATDNARDMVERGRCRSRGLSGERSGTAKLTEAQVLDIFRAEVSQRVLCARYGVRQGTVSSIQNGHTWAAVTGGKRDHHPNNRP